MTTEAELWESVASRWSSGPGTAALRAYSDRVNVALLERWLPGRLGTVLKTDLFDEATGEGLVRVLAARAERVVGIDVSPSVVREAVRRNPGLEAVVGDVRALPFEPETFDVVVSNSTLDHFDTREAIDRSLVELARVVRPGGRIVVTLDNTANPVIWLRNHLPPGFLHRFRLVPYPVGVALRPEGLRDAVTRAGLSVEQTTLVAHVPRLLIRALRLRSPWLLRAERAGQAPTRALTGQFSAVLARRPAAPEHLATRPLAGPRVRRRTIERALSATVLRRLTLLALDLDRRPAEREPLVSLSFGFLGQSDVDALERLRPGLGDAARDRFGHGECCFAARADENGRIVSVRWVARDLARIEFLDLALPLADDEAYNFDTWSDPSVRGQGVASATGSHLYATLAAEGVRTALRAVWPANEGGLRNAAREGFVPVGTLASIRLGPIRRRVVRRVEGGRASSWSSFASS